MCQGRLLEPGCGNDPLPLLFNLNLDDVPFLPFISFVMIPSLSTKPVLTLYCIRFLAGYVLDYHAEYRCWQQIICACCPSALQIL